MTRFSSLLMTLFCATNTIWAAFNPAAFTVSAEGKQIAFSQGNLQYTQSTKTWSFAENQYDMLGTDNVSSGTESYSATLGYSKSGSALADKIDLFGWSVNTVTAKWGVSTSPYYSDYSGNFVDWGKNIGDGTTYRTLTNNEWYYLRNTRTNANSLIGVARINLNSDGSQYANGLILLPDSWTCPEGVIFKSGFPSEWGIEAYATYQTFTLAEWQKLEAAGAVFLPASGDRYGSSVKDVQNNGNYWSASPSSSLTYLLTFDLFDASTSVSYRYYGQAVRLVQDIYAVTVTASENGTIEADKTEAVAGETVTLTLSPDAYYTLKTISVLQGETIILTTAVAGTTNQYTFTMPAGEVTITAEFKKLSSAFTPAKFTIAAGGKQVFFSQGNLQCSGVTTGIYTWSFAEYQTEMLGTDNVTSGTESYDTRYGYSKSGSALADKIDLFGWSGNNTTAQWGISTSTSTSDYAGDFVDWGKNIGDGNAYRTLTKDEWYYLTNTRTNANEKKGVARIKLSDTEYANGLILLPDNWTCPTDITFKSGFSSLYSIQAYADYQIFTLAEWQQLESAGAVFLPASSYRDGSSILNVQYYGYYWSATADGSDNAYDLSFYWSEASMGNYGRSYGQAVRLVQDIYAVTVTASENGTIAADKTEAATGETVTLTLSPDAYYAPKTVTVLQGKTPVTTTAVAGTTNQYTFTMPAGEVIVSAEFEKLASAFTPAKFTVSADGKQVLFSQGNLQCAGVTTGTYTW